MGFNDEETEIYTSGKGWIPLPERLGRRERDRAVLLGADSLLQTLKAQSCFEGVPQSPPVS